MAQFLSNEKVFCFIHSKNLKLYEIILQQYPTLHVKCMKISRDIIMKTSIEVILVALLLALKSFLSIEIRFWKTPPEKRCQNISEVSEANICGGVPFYLKQISVAEFRSTYSFAVHRNFAHDSETIQLKLRRDQNHKLSDEHSLWFWSLLNLSCIYSNHFYKKEESFFSLVTIFLLHFHSIYCIITDFSVPVKT